MKRPKLLLRRTLVMVAFIGCALAISLTLQIPATSGSGHAAPSAPRQQEATKPEVNNYGLPVRLRIPKINVDAAVDRIGLTPEGSMQAPNEPQNVGWYKFGPHPGNEGSAVVAGHYGPNSKDALVFTKLRTLRKGDLVNVEDEKGTIATFIVRELKTYDKNAAAPEIFRSNDKKAHLNLITCEGTWQKAQQTYSDRLVVFTDSEYSFL